MNIASTIRSICKAYQLEVADIRYTAKFVDDDMCVVSITFVVNNRHDVYIDDMYPDELESKLRSELESYHPVMKITDDDYLVMAEKTVEKGYRESIRLSVSVEIKKQEGIFFFDITSKLCDYDIIDVVALDDDDNYLDTSFDKDIFYEFLEKVKEKKAA